MIQVKEFYNVDYSVEDKMNKWLKENDKNIIVKDIKYQTNISKSWSKAYFAKYKDGNVYVYDGGKTSWSGGLITYWAEAKLYKEDE